jgi:hypothetical protein
LETELKQTTLFAITFLLLLNGYSLSQDKGFGIGVIVGEPTGVSAKSWITSVTAIDAALAWSFVDKGALHIHADYLFHNFHLISLETKGSWPIYYGIGARLKFGDKDTQLALRIPVGIDYLFGDAPVDIFLEVVPMLELIPKTKFQFNAALGARYFF